MRGLMHGQRIYAMAKQPTHATGRSIMMNTSHLTTQNRVTARPGESGVALLTVLALLAVFALILVGFTYTIRMEENTVENYSESINVEEAAEAAVQGALSQLARDLEPALPNSVLGRPQPQYISQLDPWYLGYAGSTSKNLIYDARAYQEDIRPHRMVSRRGMRNLPQPIPLSVDEDPPGDVTGGRIAGYVPTGRGDGEPGLAGVDDDLDGNVDNSTSPEDDDEDFRTNEDAFDLRRPDARGGRFFFTPGTGYDNDGDAVGIFDESAKINLNFAGNNFGPGGEFVYNLGAGPHELDLETYLYARVFQYSNAGSIQQFSAAQARELASQIVNFRYGSSFDGGTQQRLPGNDNTDDNNNNDPTIVQVEKLSDVFTVSSYEGEPFAVVGNRNDDDDDGLLNEEDEVYIGPTTINTSGTPMDGPIGQRTTDLEQFRTGDRIDNDGDGFIDEENEGVDDPAEFSIFDPKGDDRPFTSVDDLNLLQTLSGMVDIQPAGVQSPPPSLFKILRDTSTIWNQSDEVSNILSGKENQVAKLNPNGLHSWRPIDTGLSEGETQPNFADFQYSPPMQLEDLFVLQVDQDGDWNAEAELDMKRGEADGIDNNGNGFVDEPSDDWDGNGYPSGDFDGFAETDVGSPAILENGQDDDFDGNQLDEARNPEESVGRLRRLPSDEDDYNTRPRDETEREIEMGVVVEGNGFDDDGDGLVDDLGDFNGDGLLTYDPEAHVNEDAWGDLSGDGYPGLGADIDAESDTPEDDIVRDPDQRHDTLITSFADDDRDGYADFYDPQVLAAMYAPEMDGVDNDADGEVDELGERYIAAFDDDEDGRMDEDPPDFQVALNLYDYIDTWSPFAPSDNPDVLSEISKSDEDAVLADPVTTHTFNLYNSRNRVFNMHSRLLSGANSEARNRDRFTEEMRFLLPNPPHQGMPARFEGVESIRINEVMAKPVIRLEMEETLDLVEYDPEEPNEPPNVIPNRSAFQVDRRGLVDDGQIDGDPANLIDTNWNVEPTARVPFFPHFFYPDGFEATVNPLMPLVNLDAMAPAFIFSVTNVAPDPNVNPDIGTQSETVSFRFENLPAGFYDVYVYLHPDHELNENVAYRFNGKRIPMRSDTQVIDPNTGQVVGVETRSPVEQDLIRRDTAKLHPVYQEFTQGTPFAGARDFRLDYRLSYWPGDIDTYAQRFSEPRLGRVEIGNNGDLVVEVRANALTFEDRQNGLLSYTTSIDRIELVNPFAQYVELVNIGLDDIDLGGWQVSTPYGSYVIPEDTVIPAMKPNYPEDDGLERTLGEGQPGNGVPFEPLVDRQNVGQAINTDELRLEDNKVLLAYNAPLLEEFIEDNYPSVPNIEERIVEPLLSTRERAQILESVNNLDPANLHPSYPNAQIGDLNFRLFDIQEDVLVHNPDEKMISLYDPAGNYQDSFRYRTTFNNAIVDLVGGDAMDVVALPGYQGMETFERTDPTYFKNEQRVDENGTLEVRRTVPSAIQLDAQEAVIVDLRPRPNGGFDRSWVGGYINRNQGTDSDYYDDSLTRFADRNIEFFSRDFQDTWWNGWDFIGDYYRYPSDVDRRERQLVNLMEESGTMAREAVTPEDPAGRKQFYDMLGGFENILDVQTPRDVRYTAFIWRMGLRELIRAGYDPDVDDQLSVRVLGRQFIDFFGDRQSIDLPVGEVLVNPAVLEQDPGSTDIDRRPNTDENPYNIYQESNSQGKRPIFAKLRHGDTAFTVNLREQSSPLFSDLRNTSGDEPTIEIAVVMRKSTRDIRIPLRGNEQITAEDRPDLARFFSMPMTDPNFDGLYSDTNGNTPRGNVNADNYFFQGIELFGRGRLADIGGGDETDEALRYLAGTPGRDNTGYVPAYPRRQQVGGGNERDEHDIIDNTAFVKNGMLATIGEISRIATGNRFETVNTPIIPQRLEDKARDTNRVLSNGELGQRASGDTPEFKLRLAQRERLDQWESQYAPLYAMITTAMDGIVPGKININTAPREVLAALPAAPPEGPGQLPPLDERYRFNTIVADFIIEGRQAVGRDQAFGLSGVDDDEYIARFNQTASEADTLPEFKLRSVGRQPGWFKDFSDVQSERLNYLQLRPEDVTGRTLDWLDFNLATAMRAPDDGPYDNIGELLTQITHLSRRDRFAPALQRDLDRTGDIRPDAPGDLRQRLNAELNRELTPEDMEALMNRISNLVTVRSRSFTIRSRGRIFDSDGNIVAQRTLETVYSP